MRDRCQRLERVHARRTLSYPSSRVFCSKYWTTSAAVGGPWSFCPSSMYFSRSSNVWHNTLSHSADRRLLVLATGLQPTITDQWVLPLLTCRTHRFLVTYCVSTSWHLTDAFSTFIRHHDRDDTNTIRYDTIRCCKCFTTVIQCSE